MPNHVTTVCTMTGSPADVARFAATHITPEKRRNGNMVDHFNFDTIIPMPQSVKDTVRPIFNDPVPEGVPADHNTGDAQVSLYAIATLQNRSLFLLPAERYPWMPAHVQRWRDVIAWLNETAPAAAFWGRRALLAAAETGYPGWYEWSCAEWGTKWGAYDTAKRESTAGRLVFEFQTAWAFPEPIFGKLADMYPECRFDVVTIDEGGPEYEGHYAGKERVFERVTESVERYRLVYGRAPYTDDDDEPEAATS